MSYQIDSSYSTLAETQILAKYVSSSSMKKFHGDSEGRNLTLSLGEEAIYIFIWQRFYFWIKEDFKKDFKSILYKVMNMKQDYWPTSDFGFGLMWAGLMAGIFVFPSPGPL